MCFAIFILYVSSGNQPASSLISDLQEQEMTLKHCIEQLESVDMARISLINRLKEALSEQVLRLFIIFPTFHLNYIPCPVQNYIFFFFMTGVEVSSSPRSIASKNFFFISYCMLLSFSSVVIPCKITSSLCCLSILSHLLL